jgi:exopolysaccharide biosynthesis polyprenyl glycosylphosphotransferase
MQIAGDFVFSLLGTYAGYFLRFNTVLRHVGVESEIPPLSAYALLLALGALFLVVSYANAGLYDPRSLLRPHRSIAIILRATFWWFLVFLATSLILKFEPPISRVFVLTSAVTTLIIMAGWRLTFHHFLLRSRWAQRMTQQILIVGWSKEAADLVSTVANDSNHAYSIVGMVTTKNTEKAVYRVTGNISNLDQIVNSLALDIVVVADLELDRQELVAIADICERHYIAFKVIPSFFQIFVSSLRLQTIAGIPILGVEQLPGRTVSAQFVKRTFDLVGGFFGLILSAPVMVLFALLIRRENPGTVLFHQTRVGLHGRPFRIIKLRSMRLDAEKDGGAQWAKPNDPRRLKIGAFMRQWNIDELPQFWNVIKGDMSLVGPRPERPELIAQFEQEIPHYNPRHEMRPGMSGWAQVNGLRGNTSLSERIRYDLYYIENWTPWFDVQIMILTFLKRQNAY